MFVDRVVSLPKGIESFGQVRADPRGVIVAKRPLVQMELMIVIVGEVGDFLPIAKSL